MTKKMELQGRKVLVVGLARTGLATAGFLKAKGSVVTTTEMKPKEEMGEAVHQLEEMGIYQMEWGGHQVETFLNQDLIVVSPGVDFKIEPIRKALGKGIQVISEIELASRFIQTPIIAVTGTNGKTTTTHLVGAMLKEEGKRVGVGGNVGDPLILFADGGDQWEVLVVEVSSFQLEGIKAFRPKISVLLNITEDHLDRYASYEEYIEAKARIFVNQTSSDAAILNADDPIVVGLGERVKAKKFFFSFRERPGEGVFCNREKIILRLKGKEEDYSVAKAPLKGVHNVENMMAALAAVRIFGASQKAAEAVLDRFEGLEHRLEFVREINGVRFFNDSKGTNVGSVVKSLQSFSVPVILIAGGKDKNGDLGPLRSPIRERVKRMILIGEAKERMYRELGGLTETVMTGTLEEAVRLAYESAKKGDVILLSPACSSYDMFKDYKERGRVFKDAVRRL